MRNSLNILFEIVKYGFMIFISLLIFFFVSFGFVELITKCPTFQFFVINGSVINTHNLIAFFLGIIYLLLGLFLVAVSMLFSFVKLYHVTFDSILETITRKK